jgi:hypothetical protein
MLVYIHDRLQYAGLHTWPPAQWTKWLPVNLYMQLCRNHRPECLPAKFVTWPYGADRVVERGNTVPSATLHLQNSRHLRRILHCRSALQLFSSLEYSSILSATLTVHRPKTLRFSTRSSNISWRLGESLATQYTDGRPHSPVWECWVLKTPDVWPHKPLKYKLYKFCWNNSIFSSNESNGREV